jgi:hypothetical protein
MTYSSLLFPLPCAIQEHSLMIVHTNPKENFDEKFRRFFDLHANAVYRFLQQWR